MIAKCKAIAHGGNALEYVFREVKLGRILALHNLCSETPKEIHEEMKLINDYNSRCKNKFLRIEIGIAPKDESQMTFKTLNRLALLFAKQMGLDDHQWVAVTHKDTDNLHIHIIANRISLGGQVYDTTFVSNRAARVAEELSLKYRLTIANEVRSVRPHRKPKPILKESGQSSRFGISATPCSRSTKEKACRVIPCFSTNFTEAASRSSA